MFEYMNNVSQNVVDIKISTFIMSFPDSIIWKDRLLFQFYILYYDITEHKTTWGKILFNQTLAKKNKKGKPNSAVMFQCRHME